MITVLGIFSMMGAASFGIMAGCAKGEGKNAVWAAVAMTSFHVVGSLGCLVLAFRCFGGEF